MPHFIQLSPTYWINADAIIGIRLCVEHQESRHFHVQIQGQEEDLELTPDEQMAFGVYVKSWSMPLPEDPDCIQCFVEALEQHLARDTARESTAPTAAHMAHEGTG
jgi:hypothetical protein